MKKRILFLFTIVLMLLCIPAYSYAEGDGETKDLSLNDKITYTVNPREKQRFEFIPQENGVYTLNVFYERTANMNGQASFTHEGIQVPFNYTSYENADDYFKNYYNEFYGVKGNSYILEFEDYFGSGNEGPAIEYTIELTYSNKYRNKLAFDRKQQVNLTGDSTYCYFTADTSGYYSVAVDNEVDSFCSSWGTDGAYQSSCPPGCGCGFGYDGKSFFSNIFYLNSGDICITELRRHRTDTKYASVFLQKIPEITAANGSASKKSAAMHRKITCFTPDSDGEYYFFDNVGDNFVQIDQAYCIEVRRNNNYSANMDRFRENIPVTTITPGTDDSNTGGRQYYFTGKTGCDYFLFSTYYQENLPGTVTVVKDTPENKERRRNLAHSRLFGNDIKMVYTGRKITPVNALILAQQMLSEGRDFTVNYSNNVKVGKAKATVTGRSPYYGSKTFTFTILPKQVPIKKLKAGKKSFTVTWKKMTKEVTGYQIQYSRDRDFQKGVKTITIKDNKVTTKKVKKLKSKKKYYLRIRTYKKVGKKKYYSYWSYYFGDITHTHLNGLKPYCVRTK